MVGKIHIVTDLAYALESFVLFGISVGPAGRGHGWQQQSLGGKQRALNTASQRKELTKSRTFCYSRTHTCMCDVKTMGTVGTWEHFPLTRARTGFLCSHNRWNGWEQREQGLGTFSTCSHCSQSVPTKFNECGNISITCWIRL